MNILDPASDEMDKKDTGSSPYHPQFSSEPGKSEHSNTGQYTLPLALSPLLGRDRELQEVVRLLARGRLVTLTGMAGVGKTHLAFEVTRAVASEYPDGAWLVELAGLCEGGQIPGAIALALSLHGESGESGESEPWTNERLARRLGSRRALLVLDSCEHLVDSCAALAGTLLTACPGLRILATSHELLGIPGEAVLAVQTLSVPALNETDVDAIRASDAVQVFVRKALVKGFVLSPENASAIADICRRLDGLPLALELAAARVGMLSPQELAARLDDRFHLLTNGCRTAPARHQSLQAALDWGYDLLAAPHQALLRRLAVFIGGCTIHAVEDVCASGAVKREHVLNLLAELVAKSLVVVDSTAPETRYRLLETMRAYASDKLVESGEEPAVQAAYAEWCCSLVERAEVRLSGSEQAHWLARLDTEQANIRAVFEWSLTNDQPVLALRLAASLPLFWLLRGHASEGQEWIERALAAAVEAPAFLRAKAQWGTGLLATALGHFGHARRAGKKSLALAKDAADTGTQARALSLLGTCAVFTDVTKASALLEQSVALARQEGDTWSLANSLGWRGFLAIFHGDFKAARPVLEDCLAVARPARNLHGLRIGLLSLGCIARFEGDCQAAEALYKEGLAVALKLGDPLWTAVALAYLADLVNLTGFPTRARQLAEEAVTVARNARCSPVLALCLTVAGRVVLADRDFTYARALLDEALSLPQVQPCSGALALLGLAQIAFACGESHSTQPLAENALAVAREGGDKMATAQVVHYLGRLARIEGNFKDAWSLHYEALMLQAKLGDRTGALTSLAAIAGVAVDQDRWDFAVRLLAATQAFRETMGIPRPSSEQAEHEADIAAIRGNIPSAQLKTAWAQGAAMSLDGAIAYAVRGRGIRRRPRSGWASLTPTELEVVRLVAEGLTNPQIGERLFVSPRTVQTHLSNIFPKLAVRSRKELAREVARRKI